MIRWLLPTLLAASSTLAMHHRIDAQGEAKELPWSEPPSPVALRLASFGFEALVADFLWLQAIQYYGNSRNNQDGVFRLLPRIIDRIVTLDPEFEYMYRFIGAAGVGPKGEHLSEVNALLDRGARARPDVWKIPYTKAVNCLQHSPEDLGCIGEGYRRAAQTPGAPEWLHLLASRALAEGFREHEAEELLRRALENCEDLNLRMRLQERLVSVRVTRHMNALEAGLERWRSRGNTGCPERLDELLDEALGRVPLPPGARPQDRYYFDSSCVIQSTTAIDRMRMMGH